MYARAADINSKTEICKGAGVNCEDPETGINNVIKTSITLFRVIIGIIAVFYIIYAGLKFITSSGDAGKVASARNTIIYAAIGLIIVVIAPAIIGFVLNRI